MGEHLIGTLCGICWAEDFGGYILLLQRQQVQCIVMKVILSASTAHGYSVVRCQPAQCLVTSIDKNSVSAMLWYPQAQCVVKSSKEFAVVSTSAVLSYDFIP